MIQLLVASLVEGLLMRWFGVTPRSLIANFGETIEHIFSAAVSFANWAIDYVLLGAVIVVPIWLASFLLKLVKGKRSS